MNCVPPNSHAEVRLWLPETGSLEVNVLTWVAGEIYCNRTEALKDLAAQRHWPRGKRPCEQTEKFFSFRLLHFYWFTCLANTSRCTQAYCTLIHVSGNFCWINRRFFSNSHLLHGQPRAKESKPWCGQPALQPGEELHLDVRPMAFRTERDELQGLSPPSGVPPAPEQPQAPTPPSSVRRCPSLSLHPAPWLGGCPTTPPGVPWRLALAQLELDALLTTPRHLFSQLSLAGIRLPRLPMWAPPPVASAHTCLKQSRSQPASPCRTPSPTTLTPEPYWAPEAEHEALRGSDAPVSGPAVWQPGHAPTPLWLWPEPHQLGSCPLALPRAPQW